MYMLGLLKMTDPCKNVYTSLNNWYPQKQRVEVHL